MVVGEKLLSVYVNRINAALEKLLPAQAEPPLSEAMNYGVTIGGKRLRPVITLALCDALGGESEKAMPFACAVEMIHSYSLIFDDLPGMDNDSLRRGKPSNHVVYGEGISMLAGLGLIAEAYNVILDAGSDGVLSDKQTLKGCKILTDASGLKGIVTGQALDLNNKDNNYVSSDRLLRIHTLKTGAMIKAAALLGCTAAEADESTENTAAQFAEALGMAFQIKDDILDVTGTAEELGKTVGKDKAEGKTTFVDIYGLDKAQALVDEYTETAVTALKKLPDTDFLVYLTGMLCGRVK